MNSVQRAPSSVSRELKRNGWNNLAIATKKRGRALEIAKDITSRRAMNLMGLSAEHSDLMLEVFARNRDPYDFAESLLG